MYNGFPTTTTCNYQEHIGPGSGARLHLHDKIEIIYCTEGGFRATLGDHEYSFTSGDLLIINSGEKHKTTPVGNKACNWVIQFDPEILYNPSLSIFETQYAVPFILAQSSHPRVLTAAEMENGPVPHLLELLIEEHRSRAYGYELAIRGYICQMFMWILRFWNDRGFELERETLIGDRMEDTLKRFFLYVDEHYADELTVSSVAQMCNMSYSYFSRQFKRVMNVSFTDYLHYIRISKAESQLLQTDRSITEIAASVGYADSAYFIQKFKQLKDFSPNKFRKLYGRWPKEKQA